MMEYLRKEDVPEGVKKRISLYLQDKNLGNLVEVIRMSNHPEDSYLYGVIAEKNGKYNCWTCWNDEHESLNFGHYGMETLQEARETLDEYYFDCRKDEK